MPSGQFNTVVISVSGKLPLDKGHYISVFRKSGRICRIDRFIYSILHSACKVNAEPVRFWREKHDKIRQKSENHGILEGLGVQRRGMENRGQAAAPDPGKRKDYAR